MTPQSIVAVVLAVTVAVVLMSFSYRMSVLGINPPAYLAEQLKHVLSMLIGGLITYIGMSNKKD